MQGPKGHQKQPLGSGRYFRFCLIVQMNKKIVFVPFHALLLIVLVSNNENYLQYYDLTREEMAHVQMSFQSHQVGTYFLED